ncbi:MAG: hypothetical protein J7M29_10240 [Verrucomicrobia bacterium]|nr:hypothetical protein [Verrucomicrobiota bacterium]
MFALTESDLRFLVETTATRRKDPDRVIELVRGKEDILDRMLEDPRLCQRLLEQEEALVRVSPQMLFEILLRQVRRDLEREAFVFEVGPRGERLPVFEAPQTAELLEEAEVRERLVQMLASFTRTQSGVVYWREGGLWKRRKVSDMDMDDMIFLARVADPSLRPMLLLRAADIALFLSGIYPDHASLFVARPRTAFLARRTLRDYEREGAAYYKRAAQELEDPAQARACSRLAEAFTLARRALNTLSDRYLSTLQRRLEKTGGGR